RPPVSAMPKPILIGFCARAANGAAMATARTTATRASRVRFMRTSFCRVMVRGGPKVLRDLDVEQRRVLLRAEQVALTHAAAGPQPADRELDGVGGLEDDEVGHARFIDA